MNDDREVRCYALLMRTSQGPAAPPRAADEVRRNWFAQRDADDGCAARRQPHAGRPRPASRLTVRDAWRKARLGMEANRPAHRAWPWKSSARGAWAISSPAAR